MDDQSKLMQDVKTDFMDLDSLKDEHIFVQDENKEEEEADKYEDTQATSHEETEDSSNQKLEQQKTKAEAKVSLLTAQPSYPNVDQLSQLLVNSIKPKLSKLLSSYDFSSFIPFKLKELSSKITILSGEVKELKKHVAELKTLQWELLAEFLVLPSQVSSVKEKLKTLDALPNKGVPSAGQAGASPAEGEKNINQVTISQLFQRKIAKDAEKANLKQQPTTKTSPTTFQSPFFPSSPRSTPQTKGELIKKDKGKEAMSSKDAEEEETESDSENDYANPVDSMVESSKKKKKFDFITESGKQFHFTTEKIKEQKRIEESLKANLAKQEVKKVKNELVDLMGIDVVTKYYKNKLLYDKYCDKMLKRRKSSKITNCDILSKRGPIILKVYREDGTTKVIPNFKASDLHLAEWREIKTRMDYLHHTEEELKIDFNKPLEEQDPPDELNDLANKKRKRANDFHDYFKSTKKFKPLVQYEDHPTGDQQGNGKVLNEEELEFLADLGITEGLVSHSVITHNAAYQADDLDAYDSNCDEISTAKAVLIANLSVYGLNVLSEYLIETQNAAVQDTNSSAQPDAMILSMFEQLSQQVNNYNKVNTNNLMANETLSAELERYKERIRPMLYDGNVIAKETNVISIANSKDTLMLEDESRSKMLLKQSDPLILEKKVNIKPVNYAVLNQLSEYFGKHFVPQQELSAEQAFHFKMSNPSNDSSDASPVKVDVPSELPKKRIILDALTEGEWGFKHTKAVFINEIIPFFKSLKDIFNVFDKDLLNEITEVQIVFDQMETAVQQYSVDKPCLEIANKQALNAKDRLLEQIISQDIVNIVVNSSLDINDSVNVNENVNSMKMCNKYLEHEAELFKQHNMVEKDEYNKLSKNYSQLEQHCVSLEIAMQLNKEIFQTNNTSVNQTKPTFDQLFEANNLKAQLQAKDTTIKKLKAQIKKGVLVCHNSIKNDLRKLKGKDIVDNVAQVSNDTTLALGMYKLDPVILAHMDKNNRETHIYYLKHTMEQAVILREIVKQAKSLNPLDSASYTACKYVKLIQELLGYIHKPSEKLVAVTPINKKKIVSKVSNKPLSSSTGAKPYTSASRSKPSGNTKNDRTLRPPSSNEKNKVEAQSRKVKSSLNKKKSDSKNVCNEHVKHSVKGAQATCFICNECLFDANHAMCLLDHINVMNTRSKSKSVKNTKKKKEWKSTGKVFTKIRYNWRPTRRTFTLVGNVCPLTRITTTNKVPLTEPIPLNVVAQEHVVPMVYTKRPKVPKAISSSSKHMIAKSMISNRKEADTSWGSNTSVAPSSFSFIKCRHGLVRGLPKLKFEKDHLCSACAMGKSKKQSHKPQSEDTNQEKLYLLHMDLCGPIRVASVHRKKYILVIVDDYSWFTWVKFLASKDEAPDFIIKFLKIIQVRLNATVRNICTNNGIEFVNQTLHSYYESVGISHETLVARTPQQNGVVERRNHTLVEAAQTMLIYTKALLFIWAKAVATACYSQNQSIIRRLHGKTPYEILHDKKSDLSYLYVFGALCYPTNDSENLGKLQAKANIGLVPNPPPSASFVPPLRHEWDLVFQPVFDEFFSPPARDASLVLVVEAPALVESTGSPSSTSVNQDAPSPRISQSTQQSQSLTIPLCAEEESHDLEIEAMQEELNEFERLEVWELIPRPDKVMVITFKWTYKVKLDKLGGILKNNARLVTRGYVRKRELILKNPLFPWLD
ncbi:retrovirus-related pol polyprotein from transposon TNT 1-94 [Tanacetum coccineum]